MTYQVIVSMQSMSWFLVHVSDCVVLAQQQPRHEEGRDSGASREVRKELQGLGI